jgi:hypothetical protein
MRGVVGANRARRLPVVLSREEVRRVFACLDGVPLLVSSLLYGAADWAGRPYLTPSLASIQDTDSREVCSLSTAVLGCHARSRTLEGSRVWLPEPLALRC